MSEFRTGGRERAISHGFAVRGNHHPVYTTWRGMKERCENPKHKDFRSYGGRGIKVCDRWLDFKNFRDDMLPSWKPKLSIDRKDVNGNYDPSNCQWADTETQSVSSRHALKIPYNGERLTIPEISRRTQLRKNTIHRRLSLGWTIDEIMRTPKLKANRKYGAKSFFVAK